MKCNVEHIDSIHKKLSIELPWTMISDELERAYKELSKDITIKGFRKGKIPKNVLRQRFGGKVQDEVLGRVIADSYEAAVIQHRVEPVAKPELERGELKEGKPFAYTAKVEVKPEIELKETQFEITSKKAKVEAEKVEQEIENLREVKAVLVPIEGRDVAQKDDTAIMDYSVSVDGKLLEGGESKNYNVLLGEGKTIPGFEDQIIGMKVGQQKEFELTFPEDYGSKVVAGQKASFNVSLNAINARELPELNDEFVKDLGRKDCETVAELKKDIKEKLLAEEKMRIEQETKNELIDKLIEANPFPVPPSLIDRQQNAMVEEMQTYMSYQGVDPEKLGLDRKKMKEEVAEKAKREVQAAMLLSKVAETEKIEITEEEIESHFTEVAEKMGQNVASLKAVYQDPARKDELRYKLQQEKVLDFLLKQPSPDKAENEKKAKGSKKSSSTSKKSKKK
jgi:trigger factor